MTRFAHPGLAAIALALLTTACGEPTPSGPEGVQAFMDKMSDDRLDKSLATAAGQFAVQMLIGSDQQADTKQLISDAGWTDEKISARASELVGRHAETMTAGYYNDVATAMAEENTALLGEISADEKLMPVMKCIGENASKDGPIDWAACEKPDATVSDELRAAFDDYREQASAALGSAMVNTVFAGALCKTMAEVASDISTETTQKTFGGTFSLGGAPEKDCEEHIADYDAL